MQTEPPSHTEPDRENQADSSAYAGRAPAAPRRPRGTKAVVAAAAAVLWLLVLSAWQLAAMWPQRVTKTVHFDFADSAAAAGWDETEWDALHFIVERRVNAELKCGIVHRDGKTGFAIDFLGDRPAAVEAAQRRLGVVGRLEFRALAQRSRDAAKWNLSAGEDPAGDAEGVVRVANAAVAAWAPFPPRRRDLPWNTLDPKEFYVRKRGGMEEVLTLLPPEPVDQRCIMRDPRSKKTRNKIFDGEVQPGVEGVRFYLEPRGAIRLGKMTQERLEVPGPFRPRLGVLVEGKLLAAPELTEVWMDAGIIPCDFTKQELHDFLAIFSYAALPSPLVRRAEPAAAAGTVEKQP